MTGTLTPEPGKPQGWHPVSAPVQGGRPTAGRLVALDVHYPPTGGARAALVAATDLRFAQLVAERVRWLGEVAPYRPGEFFARELPALANGAATPG